jgi:hypothetical protein
VYLPDLPRPEYPEQLAAFEQEFTDTFGGCTMIRGLEGNYLSHIGMRMRDRINIIYTDTPFAFEANSLRLSRYLEAIRDVASQALEKEAILVSVYPVHHVA